MAVENPDLAGPGDGAVYHFRSGEFDQKIEEHGQRGELRRAHQCACWDKKTGLPDPACTLCYPFGFVWDTPESVFVFGPERKSTRRYDAAGAFEVGDAYFTFQTGVNPTHYSRITLPLSVVSVMDKLEKGRLDVTRFAHVLTVERADRVERVPPVGEPYENREVPLVIETLDGPPADIRIEGRKVTWLNTGIPDGTVYTLRLRALIEYIVWEPQERNEGGRVMPSKFLCKRLDALTHPKGEQAVSY